MISNIKANEAIKNTYLEIMINCASKGKRPTEHMQKAGWLTAFAEAFPSPQDFVYDLMGTACTNPGEMLSNICAILVWKNDTVLGCNPHILKLALACALRTEKEISHAGSGNAALMTTKKNISILQNSIYLLEFLHWQKQAPSSPEADNSRRIFIENFRHRAGANGAQRQQYLMWTLEYVMAQVYTSRADNQEQRLLTTIEMLKFLHDPLKDINPRLVETSVNPQLSRLEAKRSILGLQETLLLPTYNSLRPEIQGKYLSDTIQVYLADIKKVDKTVKKP
jgi:hypothetical protein